MISFLLNCTSNYQCTTCRVGHCTCTSHFLKLTNTAFESSQCVMDGSAHPFCGNQWLMTRVGTYVYILEGNAHFSTWSHIHSNHAEIEIFYCEGLYLSQTHCFLGYTCFKSKDDAKLGPSWNWLPLCYSIDTNMLLSATPISFFLLVVDEQQLYRNMVDNVLYITSVEATFTLICY